MTAAALTREFARARARSQRALAFSLAVHAVALAWLALAPHDAPPEAPYIEIAWLEPEPAPEIVEEIVETAPAPEPEPVEMQPAPAEDAPAPEPDPAAAVESLVASREEVAATLTAARPVERTQRILAAAPSPGTRLPEATLASMLPVNAGRPTAELKRIPAGDASQQTLRRGPERRAGGAALARLENVLPAADGAAASRATAATRDMGGVTLTGPVADRTLLASTMPVYPDWAKAQAVEASVTLTFRVLPDGRVKENIQIEKTSGYRDFDRNAMAATATWRFAPLQGGEAREQWGTITFRFRLED